MVNIGNPVQYFRRKTQQQQNLKFTNLVEKRLKVLPPLPLCSADLTIDLLKVSLILRLLVKKLLAVFATESPLNWLKTSIRLRFSKKLDLLWNYLIKNHVQWSGITSSKLLLPWKKPGKNLKGCTRTNQLSFIVAQPMFSCC